MAKKLLAIADVEEEVRFFDPDDLLKQLVAADFPGTAPIKYAFRNLANAVREMRNYQNEFFKAQPGPARESILKRAKASEAMVDAILKRAHEIELL